MELQDDEDEEDEDEEPAHKQQNCNFGYKFHSTDYDLIVHYLIKKILNQPLPCNRVVDDENELLYRHPSERIAASGNGYWKAMGDDKEINSKEIVVGYKKKFVFHRGNPLSGDKTNWIMKEYRITHPPIERNPRIKND
nr:nac domain-containing protein 41 [Quercus suber]